MSDHRRQCRSNHHPFNGAARTPYRAGETAVHCQLTCEEEIRMLPAQRKPFTSSTPSQSRTHASWRGTYFGPPHLLFLEQADRTRPARGCQAFLCRAGTAAAHALAPGRHEHDHHASVGMYHTVSGQSSAPPTSCDNASRYRLDSRCRFAATVGVERCRSDTACRTPAEFFESYFGGRAHDLGGRVRARCGIASLTMVGPSHGGTGMWTNETLRESVGALCVC